ncbi:Talin-2 [Halotydeus destructor]|nr:Talin-2 [Halotydeus destructor]
MATLSLKISIPEKSLVKTIQFDPSILVYDACRAITEKFAEVNQGLGSAKDYGLFLTDEDPKKGVWLEPGRSLAYYMLRNGDQVEYKRKIRNLRVRMLDGSVKTVLIDDSQPVANLMVVICTKIGITNHDEFSLLREPSLDESKESNYSTGTMTLGRRSAKEKDTYKTLDPEMLKLRKKLKTDDDLDWVDHSKTLREQGIDEEETLLLRRKYFFSDNNIDSRDPVQLNLLYVQARDAIIAGTHPVTIDQSAQFAGLQCQIQFGDHFENKHKAGFLDLKEFLPKDFAKQKGVEKKIFDNHRKHGGLNEIEAKSKYAQLARSLPTYGVTFYLVKEKMKGKNKLVPRLLGVTKESVLRLDEKTKEIIKTWNLTTVKRWAASPNSFTLDFGDYSDSYYSVQTTEGEKISQLIAGYIDIILKQKKAKDRMGISGDDGAAMIDDVVAPLRPNYIQNQTLPKARPVDNASVAMPAILRNVGNAQTINGGQMPVSQLPDIKTHTHLAYSAAQSPRQPLLHTPQMSPPQKALLSNINNAREAIKRAQIDLDNRRQPDYGTLPSSQAKKHVTFDLTKKALNAQLSNINAATAQMITLTSVPEEEMDHPALEEAITAVTSNLPEVTRDVKVIAALMEDDDKGDRLIDATRRLCSAFTDLLNAAEPNAKSPRQDLLSAASKVGEATQYLLYTIGEEDEYDRETADILLSLAKGIANTTAALVLKAREVATQCEDEPILQNKVISAATQCALATSQLVACAKVVAPTIDNPACQQQLTEASKEVAKAVENVVQVTQEAIRDEQLIGDLKNAAAAVAHALNDLLNHVRTVGEQRHERRVVVEPVIEQTAAVDTIYTATDRIFSSQGDASEMVKQAKVLAKATVQLINDLKGQAESQPDSDTQKRLIVAARLLADATARLVDAAKGCKSNPDDTASQAALTKAAEELRVATSQAATDSGKTRAQTITKQVTLISKSQVEREEDDRPELPPPPPPEVLRDVAEEVASHQKIRDMQQMTTQSEQRSHTTFSESRVEVKRSSERQMFFKEEMRSFSNGHSQHSTSDMVDNGTKSPLIINQIQGQSRGTQACQCAASTVSGIIGDLETTIMFATAGTLIPENENETFADHRENIFKTAKALVEDTKTLVAGAAASQEQLAIAAQNAVMTMVQLSEVVKQGAASLGSTNSEAQVLLINAVKDVAGALGELIDATKSASGKNVNDPSMTYLKEAAKVMIINATSLLKTVRTVEDEHQRGTLALESTIEAISQEMRAFDSNEPPTRKSSPEDLIRVTKPVTLATAKAVAAGTSGKQDDVIVAANMGRKAIFDVLVTVKQAAYSTESTELRHRILSSGRNCAYHYRQLLQMVHKAVHRTSGATVEEKQHFIAMSRTIASAVTEIVTSAEVLKGNDWVDPEDPTVIAETELLGAASSIEAAARKLASLQPRRTSVKVPDDDMNFDEMILDAARSITAATAALVRAASAAQRELILSGRVDSRPTSMSDDGQWSNGLISAARHVAAATHSLVEAANDLVRGQASEEKLISAAKLVASSTAQLLVACKVKAEANSQGMRRLQEAGNAVKKATEALVQAAQKAISHEEEHTLVLPKRRVSVIANEISMKEIILRKEKELEEARQKLAQVRKAQAHKQLTNKLEVHHHYESHTISNSSS